MSEQELAHEEVVRSVKLEQAKEVTKLRQEVEQGAKELASKYERKMKVGPQLFIVLLLLLLPLLLLLLLLLRTD